jgi:tetratricopeptide (TPR) repeat protein
MLFVVLFLLISAQGVAQDVPRLVREGKQHLLLEEYVESVESFLSALEHNPNDAAALAGLAEAYYWLAEYDQAQTYSQRALQLAAGDPAVISLAGRVAIGAGNMERAAQLFDRALEIEPNNVDARLGRAELALARGQTSQALDSLDRALRVNPEHQKALLSIALVHEDAGRFEEAEAAIERALRVHRDEPITYLVAAEFELRRGRLERALQLVETARSTDPQNQAAVALEAELALRLGANERAVSLAEELIGFERANVLAWYLRAVALLELGRLEDALTSARTALVLEPTNETVRMWSEWVALENLDLDAPVRVELSSFRANRARRSQRAFRFDRAQRAYRRAIQLAPLDVELRLEYAELLRRVGEQARYLQELRVIVENGLRNETIDRSIEIYESALSDSVSSRWAVNQYTLERSRARIGLYLIEGDAPQSAAGSEAALLSFLERTLRAEESLTVARTATSSSLAAAFADARRNELDYFVRVNVASAGRLFSLVGTLYVGRTGAQTASIQSIRSGPDRMTDATDTFVSRLSAHIPVWARIVERRGDQILLDRGIEAGFARGEEIAIVDPSRVTLAPDTLALSLGVDAELGRAEIVAVDDLISVARVVATGLMDVVSIGDMAIPEDPDRPGHTEPTLFPVLYERIRRLR